MAEDKGKVIAGVVGAAAVGVPLVAYYVNRIKQLEADLAACTANVGAYTQSLIEANETIARLEADLNVCLSDKERLSASLDEANATIKLLTDENNELALAIRDLQEQLKREHEELFELACRIIREINATKTCAGTWRTFKEICKAAGTIEELLYLIQKIVGESCPTPI